MSVAIEILLASVRQSVTRVKERLLALLPVAQSPTVSDAVKRQIAGEIDAMGAALPGLGRRMQEATAAAGANLPSAAGSLESLGADLDVLHGKLDTIEKLANG